MVQPSTNQFSRIASAGGLERRPRPSGAHILPGMSERIYQIEINRFLRVPLIAANECGGGLNHAVRRFPVFVQSQKGLCKLLRVPAAAESHDGLGEVMFVRSSTGCDHRNTKRHEFEDLASEGFICETVASFGIDSQVRILHNAQDFFMSDVGLQKYVLFQS